MSSDEEESDAEYEPDEAHSILMMQAKTVRIGRNGDAVESIRQTSTSMCRSQTRR